MNEKSIARLAPASNVSLSMLLLFILRASGLCSYVKRSLPYTLDGLRVILSFSFQGAGGSFLLLPVALVDCSLAVCARVAATFCTCMGTIVCTLSYSCSGGV